MQYSALLHELHSLKGATLITFHSLGDIEAVASAIALSKLLKNAVVKAPDKPNAAARHLLEKLGIQKIEVLKKGETNQFNGIVLVDVANKDMLASLGKEISRFKGKVIAIDHHEHGNMLRNAKIFEFPHRTSCCEIIYDLYRVSGKKVDPIIAKLLLTGVIADTARFKTANGGTFHAVSQLLVASRARYEDALSLTKTVPDQSEVENVLTTLQKAQLIKTKKGLIGIASEANAFEAKTAALLVDMGCVAGICANPRQGKIAMLKDSENPNAANINVGQLMKEAGKKMNGSGGGHASIGGCSGDPKLGEKALRYLVEKTTLVLSK